MSISLCQMAVASRLYLTYALNEDQPVNHEKPRAGYKKPRIEMSRFFVKANRTSRPWMAG